MVGAPDLGHWVVAKAAKQNSRNNEALTVEMIPAVQITSSSDRERLGRLDVGAPDTKVVYISSL